jgi:hypothetical protein
VTDSAHSPAASCTYQILSLIIEILNGDRRRDIVHVSNIFFVLPLLLVAWRVRLCITSALNDALFRVYGVSSSMGGIGAAFIVCGVSFSMSGIGDIFRVRCVIFNGWHRRHLSCMRCIVFNGWHRHLSFPSSIPVSGLTPLSFCETGVISRITLRSLKPPYFRLKDTGNLITLTNSSTESVRCLHSCDDLDFFALPCESSFISSLLGEQQLYQPRKHFTGY